MSDLDAIGAAHQKDYYSDTCLRCADPWPCDTARVFAALDALRDANAADEQTFHKVKAERDAYMRAYDHHLKATETALAERDAAKDEAAFWKEEARLCNKRYDVPVTG